MTTPETRLIAVRDWMKRFHQPYSKHFIDATEAAASARAELHREEFHEYMEADAKGDREEILDALVDMEFIACGTIVKLGLPVEREYLDGKKGIAFYQARVIMELNKTQLCQRGLEDNLSWLRIAIDRECDYRGMHLALAFSRVLANNNNKVWPLDMILPAEHVRFFTTGGYIVHRNDGKVIKPPGHPKPDFAGCY